MPSSIRTAWPGSSARRISGCGSWTRRSSPGVGIEVEREAGALLQHRPGRRRTRRCAASVPADRPGCRSAGRTRSPASGSCGSGSRIASWLAWLMLMRNTSAPGAKQPRHHAPLGGGGAERRNDLHSSHSSHRALVSPGCVIASPAASTDRCSCTSSPSRPCRCRSRRSPSGRSPGRSNSRAPRSCIRCCCVHMKVLPFHSPPRSSIA